MAKKTVAAKKTTRKKTTRKTATKKTTFALNEDMVANTMLMRNELLTKLLDPRRDINVECGYPQEITTEAYRLLYDREGIAERVVSLLPAECWRQDPFIYENQEPERTAFEDAWDSLVERLNIYHYLHRVDEMSGIGRFGVLLLGLDDGQELSTPVQPTSEASRKLLFLRVFDESLVSITNYVKDTRNERFGQPEYYSLQLQDETSTVTSNVHWSRVLHVADNRKSSEVFGTPRMRPVYNRLYDLRKLMGGSAEMFWKGAFPGLSFEVNPDLADPEMDATAMREEFANYANGLQRYLALVGVSAKSLAVQVASPMDHFETQMRAICVTLGVPLRLLLGSEAAHLASDQDQKTWNDRLAHRQLKYLSPMLVRPFIDRLQALNVLPQVEEYSVEWPDLNATSDQQKADVAEKWTKAVATYISGNVEMLVPPLAFLVNVLGMDQDKAEAILEEAEKRMDEFDNPDNTNENPNENPNENTPQEVN